MRRTVSSSTFQIKSYINAATLPPQCDFVLPGYNTLVYTTDSDFKTDFSILKNEFKVSSVELDLYDIESEEEIDQAENDDEVGQDFFCETTPWARDFITCKTPQEIYVMHADIDHQEDFDTSIFKYNLNINRSTHINKENLVTFYTNKFKYNFTSIISAGGNIFHCVNVLGQSYAIVGEMALTSQINPLLFKSYVSEVIEGNQKTGLNSFKKYQFPVDVKGEQYVERRRLNKKILQHQLGKETKLVIVPNAVEWHIDVEMGVLPNGVVLLHSFDETLKLLEKNKNLIPGYEEIFSITNNLAKISRPLLEKTKRKLEKRNFIVKDVCGFVTDKMDHSGVIACGLNSLVGISNMNDDKVEMQNIFYTLLSDNPEWYQEYFRNILKECGVYKFYYVSNMNSLEILRKRDGSIRCQHNTIPNESLLPNASFFNQKKRMQEHQLGPKQYKRRRMEAEIPVVESYSSVPIKAIVI